jgi:hypothetical protein
MATERDLWRAVIAQAIEDATTSKRVVGEFTPEAGSAAQAEARHWLTTPSVDFDEACALAELEPDQVRAYATTEIAKADRYLNSSGSNDRGRLIEFDGQRMNVRGWAKHLGITQAALGMRLASMPLERALTAPPGASSPRWARRPSPTPSETLSGAAKTGVAPSREIAPNWEF